MRTVPARQASRAFSKLLAEVAAGEEVVITRYGKPVAKLVPAEPAPNPEREAAIARMRALLEKGFDLGGRRYTREEMHER